MVRVIYEPSSSSSSSSSSFKSNSQKGTGEYEQVPPRPNFSFCNTLMTAVGWDCENEFSDNSRPSAVGGGGGGGWTRRLSIETSDGGIFSRLYAASSELGGKVMNQPRAWCPRGWVAGWEPQVCVDGTIIYAVQVRRTNRDASTQTVAVDVTAACGGTPPSTEDDVTDPSVTSDPTMMVDETVLPPVPPCTEAEAESEKGNGKGKGKGGPPRPPLVSDGGKKGGDKTSSEEEEEESQPQVIPGNVMLAPPVPKRAPGLNNSSSSSSSSSTVKREPSSPPRLPADHVKRVKREEEGVGAGVGVGGEGADGNQALPGVVVEGPDRPPTKKGNGGRDKKPQTLRVLRQLVLNTRKGNRKSLLSTPSRALLLKRRNSGSAGGVVGGGRRAAPEGGEEQEEEEEERPAVEQAAAAAPAAAEGAVGRVEERRRPPTPCLKPMWVIRVERPGPATAATAAAAGSTGNPAGSGGLQVGGGPPSQPSFAHIFDRGLRTPLRPAIIIRQRNPCSGQCMYYVCLPLSGDLAAIAPRIAHLELLKIPFSPTQASTMPALAAILQNHTDATPGDAAVYKTPTIPRLARFKISLPKFKFVKNHLEKVDAEDWVVHPSTRHSDLAILGKRRLSDGGYDMLVHRMYTP
jgi:hypothetical protein